MSTKNVLLQCLSIQLFALGIISRETLIRVGNKDSAIAGTFEGTENTGSCRCAFEADVKVAFERARGIFIVKGFGQSECAIRVSDTFVFVGKTELREGSASDKETSCVCLKFTLKFNSTD